jgi:hypothetical protein
MRHAGVWEATGANGVAGIRQKPGAAIVAPKKTFLPGGLRRRERLVQKDSKSDEEGWEAWTMTSIGTVNIYPLTSDTFASRVGPMRPVGRNAITVGLAEAILLVQFGKQLLDNDDDDDNIVKRRPAHARLTGRSKTG